MTAVEADSAVLHLSDSMETKIPLDSDHSQMVKFDTKRSEGYKSTLYYISEFEKNAPAVVAARFSKWLNLMCNEFDHSRLRIAFVRC
jgi:hypothetical protein